MDWTRWETWLIAGDGKSPVTAHEWTRILQRLIRDEAFDADAYLMSQEAAQAMGERVLAALRRDHGVNPYNHAKRALDALARFGHVQVRFKRLREAPAKPWAINRTEIQSLLAYRSPRPGRRGLEETLRRRAILWAALYTAARHGELWQLRVQDLDLNSHTFTLRYPRKGSPVETLWAEPEFFSPRRPLLAWIHHRPIDPSRPDFLWTTSFRGPPRALSYANFGRELRELGRATGIRVNFVRTRHTRATLLLNEAGHNLRHIQVYLRHRSIRSTSRYAEATAADVRTAMMRRPPPSLYRRPDQ